MEHLSVRYSFGPNLNRCSCSMMFRARHPRRHRRLNRTEENIHLGGAERPDSQSAFKIRRCFRGLIESAGGVLREQEDLPQVFQVAKANRSRWAGLRAGGH
jgi:hypothetical protein